MDESSFEAMLDGSLVDIQSYHGKLHDRVLEELADISEEELGAPSLYWEGYEMSLRFRLHRFDSHLRQHTVQANKTLHAIGQPPGEVKRLLRLIYAALAEVEGASIGAWEIGAIPRREATQVIASRAEEIASALT
jgi:hypothetical protein